MGSRFLIATLSAGLTALTLLLTARLGYLPIDRIAGIADTEAPSPIDVGFAQSMSLHHQQAIAMAQLLLEGSPSPLAPLAKQIAYTQLQELGEMRGWLRLWGEPLHPPQVRMDWMLLGSRPPDQELLQYLLACEQSPTGMSGLATIEEMQALRQLSGRARDRRFLEMMLAHHEGGLPMAHFASAEARLSVVRELALRAAREQTREVMLFRQALAAMESGGAWTEVESAVP